MNQKKLRQTKAKDAIAHYFHTTPYPATLDEIFLAITNALPRTAYSTVYRIVKQLEELGDVVRVDWRERGSRYEWAGRPHHHHIVCESCDMVCDVTDTLLNYDESQITQKTGFVVKHHSVELFGVCKPCQTKDPS